MQTPPIDLFTYALSPYGMKVYWALIYKGVEFNIVYVSPRDQNQIRFTDQRLVPIVRIGEAWRQDSGAICRWLDTCLPGPAIAGASETERLDVEAADLWVTRNVIALSFRSIIDNDTPSSVHRNGRKLGRSMRATSGDVPFWAPYVWARLLRRVDFVVREADLVDRSISVADCRATILSELEAKLEPTGFVAGTKEPSYADISLFAQLVCNTTFNMEGVLQAGSSRKLAAWYRDMTKHFDPSGHPDLVPGWTPFGF